MDKSRMSHHLRMAEGDVKFMAARIESELGWLEGHIAELRRDIERGRVNEGRNLVAKAADIVDYLGKLRSALDRVTVLEDIATEEFDG